tara:strand:- start:338 stop:679 length:342 start_codon:yes stop_codon:yes gene_type:complete
MGIRYNRRKTIDNSEEIYEELLEKRGVKNIKQYSTPSFQPLTLENRNYVKNVLHIWKLGDRYWKLATDFYGDSTLWWLIAWYNQKPTDSHVNIGDSIGIPLPLERALELFYRD